MLSSTKTTAERPSCPYAHAWPSPGVGDVAPLGAGPRHWIGHHLAEAQRVVLLAMVLSRTRLVSIPDVEVRLLTATSVSPSTIPVRLEPLS